MDETVFSHRLEAILAADAAGCSRLMAADGRAKLAALDAGRAVFRSQIEAHHGRVVDLAGDSEQEHFADGLAEDILTRLALWRWLPVIAHNSSFSFKGRAVDVKAIGRTLGARCVLEGSVRKAGMRLRVTGQLIDAETGHHLWAERCDRVLEDLFAIQDELTGGIVGALAGVVGRAEAERAHREPPGRLDACDAFMRGDWHTWRLTREDFAIAVPLFLEAAEPDPDFARPHMGLAFVRPWEGLFHWAEQPAEAFADGLASARIALALDPLDSTAHSTLALLLASTRRPDEGELASRKAIELNPSKVGA